MKRLGKGCLIVVGVLIVLGVIGSLLNPGGNRSVTTSAPTAVTNNVAGAAPTEAPAAAAEPTESPEVTAAPTDAAPSAVVGADVVVGDVRWKVTEAVDLGQELKADNTYTEPKTTGGKWIKISMEIENRGTEPKSFTGVDLVDNKDRKFQVYNQGYSYINNDQWCALNQLQPNLPKTCQVLFEIPADAAGLKLSVGDLELFGGDSAQIALGQ